MKYSFVTAALVGAVVASQHNGHGSFHMRRGGYAAAPPQPQGDVCTVYTTVYVSQPPPQSTSCSEDVPHPTGPVPENSTSGYPPAPPKSQPPVPEVCTSCTKPGPPPTGPTPNVPTSTQPGYPPQPPKETSSMPGYPPQPPKSQPPVPEVSTSCSEDVPPPHQQTTQPGYPPQPPKSQPPRQETSTQPGYPPQPPKETSSMPGYPPQPPKSQPPVPEVSTSCSEDVPPPHQQTTQPGYPPQPPKETSSMPGYPPQPPKSQPPKESTTQPGYPPQPPMSTPSQPGYPPQPPKSQPPVPEVSTSCTEEVPPPHQQTTQPGYPPQPPQSQPPKESTTQPGHPPQPPKETSSMPGYPPQPPQSQPPKESTTQPGYPPQPPKSTPPAEDTTCTEETPKTTQPGYPPQPPKETSSMPGYPPQPPQSQPPKESTTQPGYPPQPPKETSSMPGYPPQPPMSTPSQPGYPPQPPKSQPPKESTTQPAYPTGPTPGKPTESTTCTDDVPQPTGPTPEQSKPGYPAGSPPKPTGGYSSGGHISTNGNKWAITYTPYAQSGQCKTADEISADIKKIHELGFTTIRSYSTDCGVFEHVVPECQKYGLKIIYGIFLEAGEKGCFSQHADEQLQDIKKNAPKDSVAMVIVGNECIFNGNCEASQLASYIDHVRQELYTAGFPKTIAVTTTEPVGTWEEKGAALCDHIDVMAANVQPYFTQSVSADKAGEFAASQLEQAAKVCPEAAKKGKYIAEIGWPSAGNANGAAVAGKEEQKTAIHSIMDKVGYYAAVFSFQSDTWKPAGAYNVEQNFGCVEALSSY